MAMVLVMVPLALQVLSSRASTSRLLFPSFHAVFDDTTSNHGYIYLPGDRLEIFNYCTTIYNMRYRSSLLVPPIPPLLDTP